MRTNIELDEELIAYVQKEGGHKTKREAVEAALKEYRRRLAMRALLDMAGHVDIAATGAELRGKSAGTPLLAREPIAPYAADSQAGSATQAVAPRKARAR